MPTPAEEQLEVGRLGQHDRVRELPGAAGGERAVAGALLLDHAQEPQRTADRVGNPAAERAIASETMAKPPFMSPAPRPYIQPSRRVGTNGSRRPRAGLFRGDDVDVSSHEQRPSLIGSEDAETSSRPSYGNDGMPAPS